MRQLSTLAKWQKQNFGSWEPQRLQHHMLHKTETIRVALKSLNKLTKSYRLFNSESRTSKLSKGRWLKHAKSGEYSLFLFSWLYFSYYLDYMKWTTFTCKSEILTCGLMSGFKGFACQRKHVTTHFHSLNPKKRIFQKNPKIKFLGWNTENSKNSKFSNFDQTHSPWKTRDPNTSEIDSRRDSKFLGPSYEKSFRASVHRPEWKMKNFERASRLEYKAGNGLGQSTENELGGCHLRKQNLKKYS
jgi:hypothetical protein